MGLFHVSNVFSLGTWNCSRDSSSARNVNCESFELMLRGRTTIYTRFLFAIYFSGWNIHFYRVSVNRKYFLIWPCLPQRKRFQCNHWIVIIVVQVMYNAMFSRDCSNIVPAQYSSKTQKFYIPLQCLLVI